MFWGISCLHSTVRRCCWFVRSHRNSSLNLYDLSGTAVLIWQRFMCSPRDVRAYAAAAAAADTSLQAGCIVEFKTDTRQDLALLQRPNGKANWFATDVRRVFTKPSFTMLPGSLNFSSSSSCTTICCSLPVTWTRGAGGRHTVYVRSRWYTSFLVKATRKATCTKYMARHSKMLMWHCWQMHGRSAHLPARNVQWHASPCCTCARFCMKYSHTVLTLPACRQLFICQLCSVSINADTMLFLIQHVCTKPAASRVLLFTAP